MRSLLIVAAVLVALLIVVLAWTARTHTEPFRDAEGRVLEGSIAEERRIVLGGWDQYVLIRGRNQNAPLLLFVHGGPGTSEMALLRVLNAMLEDHFVVVYWDQRGAGKSFSPSLDPAHITVDWMARDLDELIDLLLAEFERERVLLVCHSWGTQLGLEYVSRHPEKVAAYIGTSQVSDSAESDATGYRWALMEARTRGHSRDLQALEAIGPPPYSIEQVKRQRRYIWKYGGSFHDNTSLFDMMRLAIKATEASWPDLIAFFRGSSLSMEALWDDMVAFDAKAEFPGLELPVYFLLGRHDRQVSSALAAEYFDILEAPHKELVWFERSAHSPPFEEPDHFNAEIMRIGRDLGLLDVQM